MPDFTTPLAHSMIPRCGGFFEQTAQFFDALLAMPLDGLQYHAAFPPTQQNVSLASHCQLMHNYLDELLMIIKRRLFSPGELTRQILQVSRDNPADLHRLVAALSPEELASVHDILWLYPHSEYAWSLLPLNREPFLRPDLTCDERNDVGKLQVQEDRSHVEYLRTYFRPLLENPPQ